MRTLLFLFLFISGHVDAQVDQYACYKALESEDLNAIESKISELEKLKPTTLVEAYRGALIAKKASFLKVMKEKLDTFKEGTALLEAAIKKYPGETEYRFLRFSIQENCPKILKYNSNLEEDKKIILKNYSKLTSKLRQIIKDYASNSKLLSPSELK